MIVIRNPPATAGGTDKSHRLESVLLTTPQLNFVFEINPAFPLNSLSNFFCQRQGVRSFGVCAVSHDEVRMLGRHVRGPHPVTLEAGGVDEAAGAVAGSLAATVGFLAAFARSMISGMLAR